MAENENTLLAKLDGLRGRFEEVSTLITDPNVIADQPRYVRLTREYKELENLMDARDEYSRLLGELAEAKQLLLEVLRIERLESTGIVGKRRHGRRI